MKFNKSTIPELELVMSVSFFMLERLNPQIGEEEFNPNGTSLPLAVINMMKLFLGISNLATPKGF